MHDANLIPIKAEIMKKGKVQKIESHSPDLHPLRSIEETRL
jgi:hypothetical protein